nr:selenium-dependent molybdenum cofactor biosynthesis protein YqeB [Candidatus Krumholzibacteria bacterium]
MRGQAGCLWIQGAGELASGIAMRLFRCGYKLIMAEIDNPLAVRRLVSFSEAVYEGALQVEGVPGVLCEPGEVVYRADQIAVVVDPGADLLKQLPAAAVIDVRMTKQPPVALPTGGAPVIGIGPGFRCGRDADLIIETHRQARLGEVISVGEASPNTGIPGVVGGQTARRVVYAPCAGHLDPAVQLGDLVTEGQVLGTIAGQSIHSALDGRVRGLIHPRAELSAGVKVADVDPRGAAIDPYLVSDKGLAIGGGVLEALLRLGIDPDRS